MPQLSKILYVEDQQDIQMIAAVALESINNYKVKVCSSGEEALAAIEEFQPDLLLLDVMMPGMDGPQTLEAVRKIDQYQSIPTIFMTAKVLPDEINSLKALGALDVISKPFDPVLLGGEIQSIWDQNFSA